MKCEHYKAWIIDSALGDSEKRNGARESELRRHLAVCPLCRKEFERERQLAEAIDYTLQRSLAAEPSPQLVIHVQQKIAGNAGRSEIPFSPLLHVPRWAAVAIICAVALTAGVIWKNHAEPLTRSRPPAVNTARMEKPSTQISEIGKDGNHRQRISDRGSSSVKNGPRSVTKRLTVATPLVAKNVGSRPHRVETLKHENQRAPQVLVPKNEMALVLQLYYETQTGVIDGASLAATPPGFKREADGSLVPALIEIKPIEIAKLDIGSGPPPAN